MLDNTGKDLGNYFRHTHGHADEAIHCCVLLHGKPLCHIKLLLRVPIDTKVGSNQSGEATIRETGEQRLPRGYGTSYRVL